MRRAPTPLILIVTCLAALPPAAGAKNAASGFEAGGEGWEIAETTCLHDRGPTEHRSAGGNPGGYISAVDNEAEPRPAGQLDRCAWAAFSPPAFSGDMRANYGGTVRYDVRHPKGAEGPAVAIFGNAGDSIQGFSTTRPPADEWTRYSFALLEAAPGLEWVYVDSAGEPQGNATRADFFAVLRNVAGIAVLGNLSPDSRGDRTDIDNVVLAEAPVPLDSDADGVTNAADNCPLQPGPAGSDGCPAGPPPPGTGGGGGGAAPAPAAAAGSGPPAVSPTLPPAAAAPACKRARAALAAAARSMRRLRSAPRSSQARLKRQQRRLRRARAAVAAACAQR